MIKKLFFILTLIFFMQQTSFAAECPFNQAPIINLKSSFGNLTYNREKSSSEITAIAKSLNISEHNFFVSGLSSVNIDFDITVNTVGQSINNSEFCIIPTEITLFLGFSNPTIYISKELKENSCEYNMVMRHEQIHHQINKSTLEYYLPLFKDAASKISTTINPVKISNSSEIEPSIKKITESYNYKLTPLVNYIKKQMILEQQRLDSPQNYSFESTICQ